MTARSPPSGHRAASRRPRVRRPRRARTPLRRPTGSRGSPDGRAGRSASSASPGLLGPPGAAGDLTHELEGALGRAQVAALQPEVGVDHPDQRKQREVVPLGDQLRADDDVGRALARWPRSAPSARGPRRTGRTTAPRCGPRGRAPRPPRPAARPRGRPAPACRPTPQAGQTSGIGLVSPHWWQTRRLRNRCSTIRASQWSQPI